MYIFIERFRDQSFFLFYSLYFQCFNIIFCVCFQTGSLLLDVNKHPVKKIIGIFIARQLLVLSANSFSSVLSNYQSRTLNFAESVKSIQKVDTHTFSENFSFSLIKKRRMNREYFLHFLCIFCHLVFEMHNSLPKVFISQTNSIFSIELIY